PVSFVFYSAARHRALPSFPTRRSSDLTGPVQPGGGPFTAFWKARLADDCARAGALASAKMPAAAMIAAMTGMPFVRFTGFSPLLDRKSTRLNSSHDQISYAVFCLKKTK